VTRRIKQKAESTSDEYCDKLQ